jgi:hypothetical protein
MGEHVTLKPRSVKAKGRRLQNFVRDRLRESFPSLEEDDIKSQTMGMVGEDIVLSPLARKFIPYSIECKNTERLQIWKAIEQAESNLGTAENMAVIFKRNNTKTYVAINIEDWLNLIKE